MSVFAEHQDSLPEQEASYIWRLKEGCSHSPNNGPIEKRVGFWTNWTHDEYTGPSYINS